MSDVTKDGERAVVRPVQNIVASMVKDFKTELKELLESGTTQLVIDLEEVAMIDSSGLGVLIAAHNSLQKIGASLELFNISDDIRTLLLNMRLDKHFTLQ